MYESYSMMTQKSPIITIGCITWLYEVGTKPSVTFRKLYALANLYKLNR